MNRTKAISLLKAICYVGIYGGLLMPLVFIPIVIFPFVFSKLIFFQVVVGLTFPAYLVLAWMEPTARPRAHLLYGAIGAYFLAIGLSVVFAVDPFRAWWGNQERMNGLFTVLHFFAWLTMAIGVLKAWPQWRRLLNYQVALSAVMAIVAMLQRIYPNLLLFPAGDRVGGLLDNPIYMAAYQIFNLFFLALLFLRTDSKVARGWYVAFGVLDVIAFLLAQSRGALVGLFVGILAFGLFYATFTKQKKTRTVALGLIAMVFLSYGLLFAFRNTAFIKNSPLERLTDFSATVTTRFIAWQIAWDGFVERPLTGWGFDNFHILFNEKYNPQSLRFGNYETWFDRAHNTVLDVLSMTGLLGFLTFIGIFLAVFYSSWRSWKKGWIDLPTASILFALPIAYFVQNLFVFDHPAAFSMSFLLYAFTIAATQADFGSTVPVAPDGAKKREMAWIGFIVLEVLALLLVIRTSIMPFQASRITLRMNSNYGMPASLELSKQAYAIWTPYLDEQAFLLGRNLTTVAMQGQIDKLPNSAEWMKLTKDVLNDELARHPRNTTMLYLASRMYHVLAEINKEPPSTAEQYYLKSIETSPKRQQLHYGLARLYTEAGKNDKAIAIYKQVRDFDLDLGMGHWLYGLSLFYDQNDKPEGAKELAASQTVAYRYQLSDVRELIPLDEAYETLNDTESMKKLPDLLAALPKGDQTYYLQLAAHFHRDHLTAERDRVLAAAQQYYPSVMDEWQKGIQQFNASSTNR